MRIGLLTSGGDAPGMNACIRAVVRYALYFNVEVVAFDKGYLGLINNQCVEMNRRSVSDILQRGGTIIKTARCDEFKTKEGRAKGAQVLRDNNIDALIVIGGDGSVTGAKLLYEEQGILTVGIPATIDNDLAYTDFAIGFDTAVNNVLSAINNIRDTMTSHDRVCIVEVMGRHCGDIALYSGIAGGAEAILIPEKNADIVKLCDNIKSNYVKGKTSDIIVLAEGVMKAQDLEEFIKTQVPMLPVRATVLGHIQRGGSPTLVDRTLAARFGVKAVDMVLKGQGGMVVGIKDNQVISMAIEQALNMKKTVNEEIFNIAQVLCL